MSSSWAGIDIGGTKIHAVVVDADGQVLGRARKRAKAERGYEAVLERAVVCLTEASREAGLAPATLTGVGVAVPSPVRPAGIAVNAPNMGWREAPVAADLGRLLEREVAVENDCNLGALAEQRYGVGRGRASLVGLFVGTGLGGGIVLDGQMVRGHHRLAAEAGHLIVRASGRRCGCGQHGCLEAYASKTALVERLRHELGAGRTTSLPAEAMRDAAGLRSGLLAEAYRAEDPLVQEVVHEAAWYLGLGVGNLITLLGPEIVVLGGGVFAALGAELLDRVRASAAEHCFPAAAFAETAIELAALGDDAVALGAAAYVADTSAQSPRG